jgi:rRNA maturation endonuclease Nob1
MEEFKYTLECPACEVVMVLEVKEEDELPAFCPMCGQDTNEEWVIVE